jgi:peptidoglycan/xylan/chitin deacetylase (PgdA/CDA1 family)
METISIGALLPSKTLGYDDSRMQVSPSIHPRRRWVVLCLHDVLLQTTASGGGPERFAVPLESFERLLDGIVAAGAAGCSLFEARRRVEPSVAITFDDATRSHLEVAAPALVRRGMTATIYVPTDRVGRAGHLTWDELRVLKGLGFSLQSHTASHPFLSELDEEAVRHELTASKAALDTELDQDTEEIAFPNGDPPRREFRHLIKETGYSLAIGSRWGVIRGQPTADHIVPRCTARGPLSSQWISRVIAADRSMEIRSLARESVLRTTRALIGPTRYAALRRLVLDSYDGR